MSAARRLRDTLPALTISQPWAALICLADDHPDAKRVENRSWRTAYRGPLAIHAGKRSRFQAPGSGFKTAACAATWNLELGTRNPLPQGALVAVADLVGCLAVDELRRRAARSDDKYAWLAGHKHIAGPVCWVLKNIRVLPEPVPYRGAQKLFRVPRELVAAVI